MKLNLKREKTEKLDKPRKNINWIKVLLISSISLVILIFVGLGSMEVIHQSDTNPNLCATCHIMQPNVTSYLTSNNLDHVHEQAGVECKDCHDYSVSAEISSGVNFLIGNYEVNEEGTLLKVTYSNEMCLECHISEKRLATNTDFLFRNPHLSHWGYLPCSDCHLSHGEQIDYCSGCHENGGQRMTGAPIVDRGNISKK